MPRYGTKRYRLSAVITILSLCGTAGLTTAAQSSPGRLTVESPAFEHGGLIPPAYTADGPNVSPPLSWRNLPAGTEEIVVIVDDPDAPTPQPFVHWVVYKIPGTAAGLPEGIPAGAVATVPGLSDVLQGMTGFGALWRPGTAAEPGYRGPAPALGQPHRYHFRVYALKAALKVQAGLDRAALLEAMAGQVIGQGELIGVYERQPRK